MSLCVVILAGGQGTRMASPLAKILHPIGGQPMLHRVIDTAKTCHPKRIIVVHAPNFPTDATLEVDWVMQAKALGTADALKHALPCIDEDDQVLVLCADVPLIDSALLAPLLKEKTLTLLTMTHPNPTPFGRIIRNDQGEAVAIVEGKDATQAQAAIDEVWSGVLSVPAAFLKRTLPLLTPDNAQQEFYLTDIVRHWEGGVSTHHTHDYAKLQGVNSLVDKSEVERTFQHRRALQWMREGLDIVDPSRFECSGQLTFGSGCRIEPNTALFGDVQLGDGVHIEAHCRITDSTIGDHTRIKTHSVIDQSTLGKHMSIGPFAHLRPQTHAKDHSKIGAFVETKAITLGSHSKAGHLAYLGDSVIGERVNIGAGVITCNYDGVHKHTTTIEDQAFIGSGTQLIAPITVHKRAYIGAGTTLRKSAASDSLTLTLGQEKIIKPYKRKEKPHD